MTFFTRKLSTSHLLAALAAVLVFTAVSVGAQSTTFDLNEALAAAQPGDTIIVPAGVYPGPLTIDRPVILEGEGWPVIEGTGEGDVITVCFQDGGASRISHSPCLSNIPIT